jgi:hypothetical protein
MKMVVARNGNVLFFAPPEDAVLYTFTMQQVITAVTHRMGEDALSLTKADIEKPSFRSAFKRRRCIIPAGGFYEGLATDVPRKQYL